MAENIIESEGAGLPIAIIRPSIVAAAWKDPYPGKINPTNEWGLNKEDLHLPLACNSLNILFTFHFQYFSGWVDNFNAATGVLAGARKGILRTAFIK